MCAICRVGARFVDLFVERIFIQNGMVDGWTGRSRRNGTTINIDNMGIFILLPSCGAGNGGKEMLSWNMLKHVQVNFLMICILCDIGEPKNEDPEWLLFAKSGQNFIE